MAYDPNFDVDAILRILGTVNENYPEGTLEDEALRIAAGALLFLRESQQLDEYREYFRKYFTPATSAALVDQSFMSRAEADTWLASGAASDGVLVSIAGEGYTVVKLPNRWEFLRTPLPEEVSRPK